ncbi:MAG: transaldolase, partial [Dehalococcoidia bacterium]|nr:transaldolase [Dehalococcoidia bacterium]
MKGNSTNPIIEASNLGQSIWLDNMRRGFLASGELSKLIELGVSGLTSNPTIFEKAIAGSGDYDQALADPLVACRRSRETYEGLILDDIRAAADLLRPVYERTGGEDGYASLEPDPYLAHDTAGTVAEVRRLNAALNRPNVMLKVPGTPEGIPAIRELISQGINVNVTLIFSLDAYRQVREAYIAGLEDLAKKGGRVAGVASVASFFVSRVDTAVDALLQEKIKRGHDELRPWLGEAAIANSRLAYQAFKATFASRRFAELRARGARVQRVLWASTSVKNTAYTSLMYVESLIGRDTIDTMPNNTLTEFLDHGQVRATLEQDAEGAERILHALDVAGIDLGEVTDRLLADGLKAFSDSLHKLLATIEEKKTVLLTRGVAGPQSALAEHSRDVSTAMADLKLGDVPGRIWRRDYTVWKPEPDEITNRLGWLSVAELMVAQVEALQEFAGEVRAAGFRHVVLLGMGGSSLGPEVARQAFGASEGFPQLFVLDSTIPASVLSVNRKIDPAHTLFLVSSKSGTTVE